MRLGDLDALKAYVKRTDLTAKEKVALLFAIAEAPTIDAVSVVCKDCKFAEIFENESYCLCLRKMAGKIRPYDFCSYGERKDGEG